MTVAYRLKGLGWFAGVTALSLTFYLVSLQVAAERKNLELLDKRIVSTQRDIRALQTEFETRANLTQLEKWNGDTLALVAPTTGQFVASEAQLASISFGADQSAQPGAPEVRTAQLVVPAAPAPVVAVTAPVATAAAAPVASVKAQVASVTPVKAVLHAVAASGSAAAAKPEVAMLDRKLLSDRTLGDLFSGARAETVKLR